MWNILNKSNTKTGLKEEEVIESIKKYGDNKISSTKKEGFLRLFIETLGDPIIKILIIALAIKTIFLFKDFDWFETVGIVIAIFVASFISSISEYGSEKAFERLQEESAKINSRVRRDGQVKEVNIEKIVCGDIVMLSSGDKVPADGILIKGNVSIDESSINGEAKEAYKEPINIVSKKINSNNEIYRGTVVYSGEGEMIVTKVGDKTFYGKLAKEIQEKQPESPLKLRLRKLAGIISKIGYVAAILVSISYLFSVIFINNGFNMTKIIDTVTNYPLIFGHVLHALTLSVTIIVVAVPEGLPMMITLVLSSNMKRMLKNNVLVRKLVGIETAGSINILFTDKTGTLTKGKLEVTSILTGDYKEYYSELELANNRNLHQLIKLSCIYNNASNYDEKREKIIGGNITDRALLSFIKTDPEMNIKKIKSIPFDSKTKYSLTTVRYMGKNMNLIKGAPEKILPYCTSYYDEKGNSSILYSKRKLKERVEAVTKRGIRVLALATSTSEVNPFNNLCLVGLVFIKDEVRNEAIDGINLVKNAHIQTVMITGDNKDTAVSIAKEVGLLTSAKDVVLTSKELQELSDEKVKEIIPNLRVVARSLPQDKSRLVRLSQELGLVVGMTGDGVNDAPALKKADVGFAMGSGTEVSKEASDIVILDDNFISISKAILYGRTIFKSIRKFIIFQITVNICAIILSIIGPFIGVATPVTVIQMLWINMVMDTLAGLAFSFEPPLLEYMMEKPKKKDEPIINEYMKDEIIFTGFYSAFLCILFLKLPFLNHLFRTSSEDIYLMTAFFGLFIFVGIFNCFNARTHRLNLFSHLLENKVFMIIIGIILIIQIYLIYYGGTLFRTAGLTLKEFIYMVILASTVIPVDFARKLYLRSRGIVGGV